MADKNNGTDELKFDLTQVTARMVQDYNVALRSLDNAKIAEILARCNTFVPFAWGITGRDADEWLDLPWATFVQAREEFTKALASAVKN